MSLRTDRIAHQLQQEVARVLRDEVTDRRVKMVTVLRVDVAPDLSNAVVGWSLFEGDGEPDFDEIDEVEDGLESASSYIRRKIAASLNLRRTPALRFEYDPSLRLAGETMEILQEIAVADETAEADEAIDTQESAPAQEAAEVQEIADVEETKS
ncbi:MAG: 30S ribosome-binding factor RbfA [Myxococcota bacterium]|jgi:ribosome-binding factor A|nr:30S ribosome-binding factor RbfA [Myxococcota bacterium]